MGKSLDIEALKVEHVGKTYNWLTVLDVLRYNHIVTFKCKCKCGTVKLISKKNVLSGHTTSCGCYKRSKEKGEKYSQWCKDNPDKVREKTEKYIDWCANNPEKLKERGIKYSIWCKDNPEAKRSSVNKKIATYSRRRADIDYSVIIHGVHPDDVDPLLLGHITAKSYIRIKCPICGNFERHRLHNVFTFCTANLKFRSSMSGDLPLCHRCVVSHSASSKEKEIANFISTFYNGTLIRNSRDIISPLELDLYYPEKKIAIEYNGDYFHNEDHKSNDYHYNKFITCTQKGITLVSIFETEWITHKELIENYLFDLFNNTENSISFNEDKTMLNNNYPSPITYEARDHIEHYYTYRSRKVFTCGYEKLV